MKKLFLLLTLFGVLCSSCSKEGDEVSNPQEPPKTEEDVLIIDGDRNYVVDALGGELVVKVKTNKGYGVFIPEEASWITLADTRSLREDELTFIISPNEEFAVRCATLTLSVDWDTFQEITIVQNPASIDIPNNQIWYTSTNGEIILPYIGRGNSYADALTSFGANIISNTYENGKGVITFDSDVTKIGECAFCGYYSLPLLPDSSEESEGYTLCRNLATILIPNSVTTIGDYAFMNCNSLISITAPNSVLTIGSGSFRDCYKLISVTIPDSVTTIGDYAFDDCYGLTSVTIPDSVTTIGDCAFRDCNSLTNVTIPDSVTTIGDGAFAVCSSLQEFKGKFASEDGRCLIIDGTLNSFAPAGLTEYTIPDSVTTIGDYAFDNCHSLTCVTIPDSVTTIGYHAFSYCSSLISTTITNGVTTVEDYAFWHCESLTDVALPNSVATIGNWAFECCSSLTSVAIGNGVTEIGIMAFQDCTSLTNVYCKAITPPTGSIGMFSSNASNRIIYVPRQSVESYISAEHWRTYASYILGYDFKDDDEEPSTSNNIITYTATSKVEPYSDYFNDYADAFTTFGANIVSHSYENGKGVINFDNDVTKIGEFAFRGCTSLESINIPDSVVTIGWYAFEECIGLKSVTIGNSVPEIGEGAFRNCSNLKEFKGKYASEDGRCLIVDGILTSFAPAGLTEYTIPDSVTTIGEYAFFYCRSLTSVTIPDSVTEIGVNAFWYCTSLESIDIPNSVTEIGEGAFGYCSNLKEFKGKYASEDGRCLIVDGILTSFAPAGLTEYTIPDSVTVIGESAFYYCKNLTSIVIPDSVTEIGIYAFSGCTSLEGITIPDSVTEIGDFAFWNCSSLESITIPESVSEIGLGAITYCNSLESVYCKSTIPPTCSGDPFDAFGFRIYVPKDSVDMYKDAPYWNSYSHHIVAYDYDNNCIYRPEASDIVKTWLGTYSAYTEEIIDIRERIVREQRTDFTFSVEPIDGADDQVYVYGLSVLGSDVPALGHVWTEAGVNYLAFYNQFTVAEFSSGYDPTWLPYCILSDGSYSFVTGDYYPMAFMMSADGTIEGFVSYGEISDGRSYEVVAFDLVALDFNNGVFRYYYDEYNNPYTQWKHGVVKGITKVKSASVSRKSVDLNQFIVGGQLPCSVVVAQ